MQTLYTYIINIYDDDDVESKYIHFLELTSVNVLKLRMKNIMQSIFECILYIYSTYVYCQKIEMLQGSAI